jgi:uncharacterized protein
MRIENVKNLSIVVLFFVLAISFSFIFAVIFGNIGLAIQSELFADIFSRIGQLLGLLGFFIIWFRDITYFEHFGLHVKSDTIKNSNSLVMGGLFGIGVQLLIFISFILTGLQILVLDENIIMWFIAGLIPAIIIHLCVGVVEELLFRGYLYKSLKKYLPYSFALIIQAIVFSLSHYFNPGFSMMAFAGLFLFGVLMALLADFGGSLLLPIAFHTVWNVSEGSIFGFSVSGEKTVSLLSTSTQKNDFLYGGLFGPEASIYTIVLLLLCSFVVFLIIYQKTFKVRVNM